MNKLEIIAKLLKEDKLTVQEAAILMQQDVQYVPYYPYQQTIPYWSQPFQVGDISFEVSNTYDAIH